MRRIAIALMAASLIVGTSAPALASYTNNNWQNGWPQHANMTQSWCGNSVPEHNKWASLYAGFCVS